MHPSVWQTESLKCGQNMKKPGMCRASGVFFLQYQYLIFGVFYLAVAEYVIV